MEIGPPLTLAELAALVGGRLQGDPDRIIRRAAGLDKPDPEGAAFALNGERLKHVQPGDFGVILAPPDHGHAGAVIEVSRPRLAFCDVLAHFHEPAVTEPGIHPLASVDPTAHVAASARVGPGAFVGPGAEIGADCQIHPGAYVGQKAKIGARTRLMPNAVLHHGCETGEDCILHAGAVVGADGFGFEWDGSGHRRLPHVGRVVLGSQVEVGACACVDRALIGETRVGDGTKIDNLVQVGHNARLGRHVILAGLVGLGGSVEIGDGAVLGGQTGVGDHLTIAPGARLGGQTAVRSSITEPGVYAGAPAMPYGEAMRVLAATPRLPEMARRLRSLERELQELKDALATQDPQG